MNEKELRTQIARLETMNDYLVAELEHLDHLMQLIGFQRGLQTVKSTAEEIIRRGVTHMVQQRDLQEEEIAE